MTLPFCNKFFFGILAVLYIYALVLLAPRRCSIWQANNKHTFGSALAEPNDLLENYKRLTAVLNFPQLYPSCGHVVHPEIPSDLTEARSKMNKSQHGEDIALFDAVFNQDTEPGTFLEIGALDGTKNSNSYFYEHALGWKGILVEPNPINAADLRKANRPRSAIFTVAVCQIDQDLRHPDNLTFTKQGGGVATAVDYAAPAFLGRWKKYHGDERVVVPCLPLQLIIDDTGLWDIDFFSLDVEGAEKIVLETVDLNKTNIRVLMVEQDGLNKEKDEWVRQHLYAHGFTCLDVGLRNRVNEVYLNLNFAERKARRPILPIRC